MLLQETITRAPASGGLGDLRTNHSSRRRKKLASFMGTLLEEMTRAETTKAPSTTGNTSVLGKSIFFLMKNLKLETQYLVNLYTSMGQCKRLVLFLNFIAKYRSKIFSINWICKTEEFLITQSHTYMYSSLVI